MTWETLIAIELDFAPDFSIMEGAVRDPRVSADTAVEVYLEESKTVLAIDVRERTGYDVDDADHLVVINRMIDKNPKEWRRLISRRQLAFVYELFDQGPDSMNRMKLKKYGTQYDRALASLDTMFRGLTPRSTASVRIRL